MDANGVLSNIYDEDNRALRISGPYTPLTDPLDFGFVVTPLYGTLLGSAAWATANKGMWMRCITGGSISSIRIHVLTQNGNICVAAYSGTGTGLARVPDARLATSGSVACPAVGAVDVALGATVTVAPGDFLYLGSDSATVAFYGLSGGSASTLHNAMMLRAVASFPAPDPAPAVVADSFRAPLLIGVP